MTSNPWDQAGEPNPLRALTPDQLRRRTSMKWRTHPADVLPLWVAEMDVPLARPVVRAVTEAMELGDTGYPVGTAYAEALAAFAAKRWGWDGLAVERTAIVPDVMLGVVEMLKLVTGPGDPVIVNPPVYPPFYQFVTHMDRRVVEAPSVLTCGSTWACWRRSSGGPSRAVAGRPSCCAARTTRPAPSTPPRNWRPSPPWPSGTASGSSPTRSTLRSSPPPTRGSCPTWACPAPSAASP